MNSYYQKFISIMIERHGDNIKSIFGNHNMSDREILTAVFKDTVNDIFEYYDYTDFDEPEILAMLEIEDILSGRRPKEEHYPTLEAEATRAER